MPTNKWLLRFFEVETPSETHEQTFYLLRKLLLRLDTDHFCSLEYCISDKIQSSLIDIVVMIGKYLAVKQFKRLKPEYQTEILVNRNINDVLGLVLYVVINSELASQIIQIILELSESEQLDLMGAIKLAENQCENTLELKKYIQKIELISQQNDELKESLGEKQQIFEIQNLKTRQIETDNQLLLQEIDNYQEQKKAAFQYLDVKRISQFVSICKETKVYNESLTSRIATKEEDRANLQADHHALKDKIKQFGKSIQSKLDQIEELKSLCRQLDEQFVPCDEVVIQRQTLPLLQLPLIDNKNILNISGGIGRSNNKIQGTDRTNCSTHEEEESFYAKNNLHKLLSLNELERQQKEKHQLIQLLKGEYLKEVSSGQRLKKKLKKLQRQHFRFMEIYRQQSLIY